MLWILIDWMNLLVGTNDHVLPPSQSCLSLILWIKDNFYNNHRWMKYATFFPTDRLFLRIWIVHQIGHLASYTFRYNVDRFFLNSLTTERLYRKNVKKHPTSTTRQVDIKCEHNMEALGCAMDHANLRVICEKKNIINFLSNIIFPNLLLYLNWNILFCRTRPVPAMGLFVSTVYRNIRCTSATIFLAR